ncbi:protein phosphatase 1 regulatory subunit 3D-like [Boleophthalmus pectinirostris]|uniref:protein phosphatase 1 regulatory subunit 3D-like n=1 Tax=Boleophthalmus pectinirostris TaxID=150288 RepID=UPI000A1C3AB6|nr:protein phosphatase 1 regulatory subunit 3D-like [Boleophthalmus pectinirostris]
MADMCQKLHYGRAIEKTICLRNIYDPKPVAKAPVKIRPPPPRSATTKPQVAKPEPTVEPPAKPIMRKRAKSLSFLPANSTPPHRNSQVRFVDALGLELEEVKVFKVQEHPHIPHHVMFRLLMSSEMAFRKSLELSLPYFKPCFPEDFRSQPNFMERLYSQCVCLEKVNCSDQGITGTICVLNIAFEKYVSVHYSFTNWRMHTNTTASWVSSGGSWGNNALGIDVFRFRLPVPPFILEPGAILEFAICYTVNGVNYWDNYNGQNYKLSCHSYKVTVPKECEDSMLHFT